MSYLFCAKIPVREYFGKNIFTEILASDSDTNAQFHVMFVLFEMAEK